MTITGSLLLLLLLQPCSCSPVVPTFSLAKLHGTPSECSELVDDVRRCCHEGPGFFFLVDHGIPQSHFDMMLDLARRALTLPTAEKERIHKRHSPRFRGWEPTGMEHTGGKPDAREQVDTWTEMPTATSDTSVAGDVNGRPAYMCLQGPNQFFDDSVLPGYRELTLDWHARCSAVAAELTQVLSLALDLPIDALGEAMGAAEEQQSLIKYIRYPPTPEGGQGVGLHQDTAFLTLLIPDADDGLECQLPSGEMLPVTRQPGAFVVNLGEALQLLSGNYFVATPHRVIANRERVSIGFFFGPALTAPLRPLSLAQRFAAAVAASERHRRSGLMPTREELERGVDGSTEGAGTHETYGDMLWRYFARAHTEYFRTWYPRAGAMAGAPRSFHISERGNPGDDD
jgi:isopenicillin N synthase-like dioxygenase